MMKTVSEMLKSLEKADFAYKISGNQNVAVSGFSSLFHYRPDTMTFIVPERTFSDYEANFKEQRIALLILPQGVELPSEADCGIHVEDPRKVFFYLVEKFFDDEASEEITSISSDPSIYTKQSFVSPKAVIGKDVRIGIGCVIEGNVIIGDRTVINHNVVIRNNTKIGSDCTIFSGARIGERGYNYSIAPDRTKHMLKHYGGVTIGNNVHIGENVCISRGAIDDTTICDGVKIDALVHIAHNCIIGKNTLILVPTSISGSAEIGEDCHIAADILINQVKIGDRAMLGLGSVVVRDIPENVIAYGNPAKPVRKRFED